MWVAIFVLGLQRAISANRKIEEPLFIHGTEALHPSACLVPNEKHFLLFLLPAHMPSVQPNVASEDALQGDYEFNDQG